MVALRRVGVIISEREKCKVVAPLGLVSIVEWTKVEHAFAVETYFSNGRSIIATQRAFCTHFNIAPHGRVPVRETGDVKEKNLLRVGIIDPWFLEENERAVSVTSDHYVHMIQEFFLPKLNEMYGSSRTVPRHKQRVCQ